MAWATPHVFSVGEILTAANMNVISDNLRFLHGDSGATTLLSSLSVTSWIASQVSTTPQMVMGEISPFVGGSSRPGLVYGSALDTNEYRKGAQILGTDTSYRAGNDVAANTSGVGAFTANTVAIGHTGGSLGPYIIFGTVQANLYMPAASIIKTDGSFADMGYGTSLPGSPVDGQRYVLVDSTTSPNYQWTMRYNASSSWAQKWEYVGGSPAVIQYAGQTAGASTTYADLASPGQITVPRTGLYAYRYGGHLYNAGSTGAVFLALAKGATAAVDGDSVSIENHPIIDAISVAKEGQDTANASDVLKLRYRVVSGSGYLTAVYLSVHPIRVS